MIEHTRDRFLAKVFDFRNNVDRKDVATDEDYELLYAYGMFFARHLLYIIWR